MYRVIRPHTLPLAQVPIANLAALWVRIGRGRGGAGFGRGVGQLLRC